MVFWRPIVLAWKSYDVAAIRQLSEVGTNNIIPKAKRNKPQQSFQQVKPQRKMRNLFFLTSEAQRNFRNKQRWSRGHKARGQGQKKKSEAKAKDSLSEDRRFRGQGQECSRPRPKTKNTSASALQKKKKKGLHKNFSGDLQKKKGLHKNFSGDLQKKKGLPKTFSSDLR